jgi:hypothetical protein
MDKTYYGNVINLSGLYSKTPIKCDRQCEYDKNIYWDESGNFDINLKQLGIKNKEGYVKFTSENEDEVKLWTNGVLSAMLMIKKWCR